MILDQPINNVAELLTQLAQLSAAVANEIVWFRGHGNVAHTLLPSIARHANGLAREEMLLKRFKQNAFPFTHRPPQEEWDWLFLMQHFGVPTRLLDWTESPLVGLYFAVEDPANDATDGCLWCLLPMRLNGLANIRPALPTNIPCFGMDQVLNQYMPETMFVDRQSHLLPAAAIAQRQNERIYAQLGVFTIMHRDQTPIEAFGNGEHIARFGIPAAAKAAIRTELLFLRITRLSLFPELTSVATVAREVLA